MFHKRLLKEFKDIRNRIVGMVIAQWCMLLANAMLLFTAVLFIAAHQVFAALKRLAPAKLDGREKGNLIYPPQIYHENSR